MVSTADSTGRKGRRLSFGDEGQKPPAALFEIRQRGRERDSDEPRCVECLPRRHGQALAHSPGTRAPASKRPRRR